MIFESTKPYDIRFVARIIRRNKLTPWPIKGWYKIYPVSWSRGSRSLSFEWYPWGAVLFVADGREPSWASTLVCVGTVNLCAGIVTDPSGEVELIPIPWIDCVAKGVEVGGMGSQYDVSLPSCLGWHEHCPTCDGGATPDVPGIEPVCAWRLRCYALKLFLGETGQNRNSFIESFTDPVTLHTKLAEIERERIQAIPAPAVPPDYEGCGEAKGTNNYRRPGRRRRAAYIPNNKLPSPTRFERLEPLVRAFLRRLRKGMLRLGYRWVARRPLAVDGSCYVVRIVKRANYVTVYIATERRHRKVCVLWLKPQLKQVNVGFHVPFDDALGVPGTFLKPSTSGLATSVWKGIKDETTARVAAKMIIRMIKRGLLKVPPPPKKP